MAAETPTSNERVLVVGLSTNDFNEQVREFVEPFFRAVEMVLPIEHSVGQPLLRTSEIPPDTIIVAFSTGEKGPTSVATKITEAFNAYPQAEHYFVFPDDLDPGPLETFINRTLPNKLRTKAVVSLRNLIGAFEQNFVELRGASAGVGSAHATAEHIETDELFVTFDQSLSPEQIKGTLAALASYYRACGGVGLPAEFESQEALVLEDARV